MKNNTKMKSDQEVNLNLFLEKVWKNRRLFLVSIGSLLALAILYIILATPTYEASTSLLIDPSGSNRILGESKYVDGGVGLIEIEKNLYNEIGILKSFSLIRETVEDLGHDISYHAGSFLRTREQYGYYPFEITLNREKPQLYGVPFEVILLPENRYRLTIEADDFMVSNPATNSVREVDRDLEFSEIFEYGQEVNHDYFNFILDEPLYDVSATDFEGDKLSFVIHNIDDVTNSYLGKITVDNIDIQASIVQISSSGALVEKEVDFLNKLTENYIDNKLYSRNNIASGKEEFLRAQLEIISDSLLKTEIDLEAFKRSKNAVNLDVTAINALDRTQNLEVDRAKRQMDLRYYNSLIRYVQNNRGSDDFSIPTSMGIEDPLITGNLLELQRLYSERSRKKNFVTSNNQELTILNNQIEEYTGLLLNNLRSAVRSARMELGGISAQLADYDTIISTLPLREKQLLAIERQSTLYENLFNYLSQELAKTGIAKAESTTDTRVLDKARMVGDGPVAPQKTLILALAITLGALIPVTKIVFFSPTDVIENLGQIIENTDIPVIASIAHHDRESSINDDGISLWNVKESFRDLFANLKLLRTKKRCTVLGITSILPEEGKTFCAINLGITLAETGRKTLIIDTDLRSPSLVKGFDKSYGRGFSEYLEGKVESAEDLIYQHQSLRNLQFIPTAVVDTNVHELLTNSKFTALIDTMAQKYDYIILDTPAVGLVSDYLLYSDVVDINLFVVRRGIARLNFLDDFERIKRRAKLKKSYIIFNDREERKHKYGYGQKYGQNKEAQLVDDTLTV